MRDFSRKTVSALARKGIRIIGITVIPDPTSDLPFASGERGYSLDDNGCGRIVTFAQVLELAA